MGMLGQTSDPKVEAEVQKVLAACKKVGMPCGIIAIGPEAANQRIAEGFTNVIVGIDILYLLSGASGALGQIARKPA
jgi:2-dehydro-3-deoxyglucarate aldolase/4-hydroxy-2-oxoheptanedioate aldolase